MKVYITVSLLILLTLNCLQTNAQRFGIQAGLNLANQVWKDNYYDYSTEYEMNPGFNAGVTFEYSFKNIFSVEADLLVETKGFMVHNGSNFSKTHILYGSLPVMAKAGVSVGKVRIFAGIGPYIGFAYYGRQITKLDGNTTVLALSFGNDKNQNEFRHFDWGIKYGAGIELKHFCLGLYFVPGIANISTYTGEGTKIRNKAVSLTLGYKLGRK